MKTVEQQQREEAMFGQTAEEVLAGFDNRLFANLDDGTIYVVGMLSDVQEMIERGLKEPARQTVNAVKLVISARFGRR